MAEALNMIPMSVIEDIKAEIASMSITSTNPEDFTRTMAELYSFKKMVLHIIDKHISRNEWDMKINKRIHYLLSNGSVVSWRRIRRNKRHKTNSKKEQELKLLKGIDEV